MPADILVQFMIVSALTGAPVPKAYVHCDGWGIVTDTSQGENGWALEFGSSAMRADSRGAAFGNAEPSVNTCHAWKDGYGKVSQIVVITEKNRKFTFKLPEAK